MKCLSMTGAILLIVGLVACTKEKAKPLVPLPLDPGSKPQAIALTEQGTRAFQSRQFEDAKTLFSQAMSLAPESGQAHYNYALALNALGDTETARQQFMEAANLAPGDRTIWDSPALSPYGNPQRPEAKRDHTNGTAQPI